MIMPVMWFALAEAQVLVSNKTRSYPQCSLAAVACHRVPPRTTREIHRGHRTISASRA